MTVVSVVIATRNRRELLSEAIASVYEQTFEDWELIVVDDASTDDTWEYLATLRNPRVRTLRQPQHGERSEARNRGLAEARGVLIMFLDDDDLLRANTLAALIAQLNARPDAVAAVGACRILHANGDSVKVFHPSSPHCRIVWQDLLFGWWANSGQNLYRTEIVRAVGGFDASVRACEDRKLWLEVARLGPVCLTPVIAMEYRQHAGQSKLPDLDEIRHSIWREFISSLPAPEQRGARAIRRAAELALRAELLRSAGRFTAALTTQLAACLRVPRLLTSPLTGRPLWWGVKKCLIRERATF